MASERSKKTRSIGNYLNDLNKRVSTIDKNTTVNSTGSVATDSLATESITADTISDRSITVDKLDSSSLSSDANPQKVPALLKNVDYWSQVQVDGVKTIVDAYFGDYGVQNIEATEDGIILAPERATPVAITSYELSSSGVVTLATNVAHDYEIGDTITVYQLGSPFDGRWDIVEVPTTASLAYSIANFYEPKVSYKDGLEDGGIVSFGDGNFGSTSNTIYYTITSKSCIDGVATFTIDNNLEADYSVGHGLEVGYVVDVQGSGSPYDGTHIITEIPENEISTIKCSIVGSVVEKIDTAFPLTSATSDGAGSVKYIFEETLTNPYEAVTNEPIHIYGFTPTTALNITGTISQAYSPSEFSVISNASDPAGTVSTGGMAITAFVKVDAEARLFLTGRNTIPDSRSVSLSWISDKPVDVYAAYWTKNQVGGVNLPTLVKIDDVYSTEVSRVTIRDEYFGEIPVPADYYNPSREISKLQGAYSYYWEVPPAAESYTIFAEVLPGKDPVLLKEFYVFENVGDIGHKIERVVAVSLDNSVATVYTATTHPYQAGDRVTLYGVGIVDPALENIFTIDSVDPNANYFTINAYGIVTRTETLDADLDVAPFYVSGTVVGGPEKHQSATLAPSGFGIIGADGSQAVVLTEDKTDNYLSIYNANSVAVASISNTGDGTFSNVAAQIITADGVGTTLDPVETVISKNVTSDLATITEGSFTKAAISNLSTYGITANNITVSSGFTASDVYSSSANTYIVGTFANARYNNTVYTGSSYMDRLARGVIYHSYWDIPTTSIPSGIMYYGLANGTFTLESGRAYQMFVGAGGLRLTPNQNVAMELLLSPAPIKVSDTNEFGRLSFVLPTSGGASQYFRDMIGYFQSVPATGSTFTGGVTTNLTSATISSWSKTTGSTTVAVTLSNSTPLTSYLKTGDYVSISNVVPSISSESVYYNGIFPITKTSSTTFTYTHGGATTTSASNSAGNVVLVEPQLLDTAATFSNTSGATSTANTVSFAINNYFVPGQRVSVTGFSAPNTAWNVTDAFITSANATSFTVSSTAIAGVCTSPCVTATVTWTNNQLEVNKTVLPAQTTIYWILRLRHGSTTTAVSNIITTGHPAGIFSISDMGQAKTLTYSAPTQDWVTGFPPALKAGAGTAYVPPAATQTATVTNVVTTNVVTVTSSGSAYYDNFGKGDYGTSDPYANEQSLYQGNAGTSSGTKKSQVVFTAYTLPKPTAPNANVTISNTTVTKVEVYLRNRHSYNASGLTTRIGISTGTTLGTSITTSGVTAGPAVTSTTFTKGQGKWVTLGSGTHTYANTTTLRSILISLTDQNPITYDSTAANYGYFDGDLQSDPPKLRITYTYTTSTTTYS